MTRKDRIYFSGIVTSIPISLLVGYLIAEFTFNQIIFKGHKWDIEPGDALFIPLATLIFAFVLFFAVFYSWSFIHRRWIE